MVAVAVFVLVVGVVTLLVLAELFRVSSVRFRPCVRMRPSRLSTKTLSNYVYISRIQAIRFPNAQRTFANGTAIQGTDYDVQGV